MDTLMEKVDRIDARLKQLEEIPSSSPKVCLIKILDRFQRRPEGHGLHDIIYGDSSVKFYGDAILSALCLALQQSVVG